MTFTMGILTFYFILFHAMPYKLSFVCTVFSTIDKRQTSFPCYELWAGMYRSSGIWTYMSVIPLDKPSECSNWGIKHAYSHFGKLDLFKSNFHFITLKICYIEHHSLVLCMQGNGEEERHLFAVTWVCLVWKCLCVHNTIPTPHFY